MEWEQQDRVELILHQVLAVAVHVELQEQLLLVALMVEEEVVALFIIQLNMLENLVAAVQ